MDLKVGNIHGNTKARGGERMWQFHSNGGVQTCSGVVLHCCNSLCLIMQSLLQFYKASQVGPKYLIVVWSDTGQLYDVDYEVWTRLWGW